MSTLIGASLPLTYVDLCLVGYFYCGGYSACTFSGSGWVSSDVSVSQRVSSARSLLSLRWKHIIGDNSLKA